MESQRELGPADEEQIRLLMRLPPAQRLRSLMELQALWLDTVRARLDPNGTPLRFVPHYERLVVSHGAKRSGVDKGPNGTPLRFVPHYERLVVSHGAKRSGVDKDPNGTPLRFGPHYEHVTCDPVLEEAFRE